MEKGSTEGVAGSRPRNPGKSDLWDRSTKLLTAHLGEYTIMLLIFAIVAVIVSVISGVIVLVAASSSVTTLYGSISIYAPNLSTAMIAGIVELVSGAALALVGVCFIASIYELTAALSAGRAIDYAQVVIGSINTALSKTNTTVIVAGIGALGGLVSGLLISRGILGAFIGEFLVVLWVGVALSGLSAKADMNFLGVFGEVNNRSSNSGAILYVTLLIAIVPIVGMLLTFILTPLAVVILAMAFGDVPAPNQAAAPDGGQKSIKVE